jgi:hypothetical protein
MSRKQKRKRMMATAIAILVVLSTILGTVAPLIINS